MVPVVLICGVQGSGKSWACRQVAGIFDYVAHDRCWKHPSAVPEDGLDPKWGPPGSVSTHFEVVSEAARGGGGRPVLTEVPFGESELKKRLESAGIIVIPVFVVESDAIISSRYEKREKKPLPAGVLTRNQGLARRARDWGAFSGTSAEVRDHLRRIFGFTARFTAKN
jgi:hypothetical protein